MPDGTRLAGGGSAAAGAADSTAGLNRAQREAVTHSGGPLIVLAGPGTGKTRVITHRIAHLVRERGADPSSIVAVTFTLRAAEQLRERLAAILGAPTAERVNAHTIHGFGLRILRRNADLADLAPIGGPSGGGGGGGVDDAAGGFARGRVRRCELIDSAQSRRMLRRLILDNDLFGHARAGGVESLIEEAGRLFDAFDNHALTPEGVAEFVQRWGAAVDAGRGIDGETLDVQAGEAARAAHARFAQFAELHRLFDSERRAAGLITFGDLLMIPIRLMRRHPAAAAWCRSRFKHWLVDEFQDVNTAQIELLRLLAPPGSGGGGGERSGPDLCVVGDDDQSIYGFRGADDQAFRRFSSIWSGARVVALTENYRSRPRIIDAANSIIERAEHRFAPDKTIEFPRGADRLPAGEIDCVQLREEKEDGEAIASMIRTQAGRAAPKDSASDRDRPDAPYKGFAVVARSHSDLDRIEEALWLEGIPTLRWKRASAADEDGVKDVMAWLKLIAAPREPWHARRLLMRPPIGLSLESVNSWDQQYRAAASRARAARESDGRAEDPGLFPRWLRARATGDGTGVDTPTHATMVEKFCRWFDEFAEAATRDSAAAVVVRIVRETGVVHADLSDDRSRVARVESIVAMLNFVQARQGRLPAPGGVREFLEYYEDLAPSEQGFTGSSDPVTADEGEEPEGSASINAVRLITAHSAKGLEFDTVFVPRVQPPHGYPKTSKSDELEIPEGLIARVEGGPALDIKERRLAEERRLFYVACTRAERRLVLLSKQPKGKSSSTNYFKEILGVEALRSEVNVVSAGDVVAQALREAGRPGHDGGADALRGLRGGEDADTSGARDRRRELFERARREARLAAAGALARIDDPLATESRIDEAKAVLGESADRMAAIARVEAEGKPPPWADRLGPGARAEITALLAASSAAMTPGEAGPRAVPKWLVRVPRPPLRLSYTAINDYLRCPRCYYVKHVLEMRGPEGKPAVLGIAIHRALERFYNVFREADANGVPAPGLPELEAMAREEFFASAGADDEINAAELDRLTAQVRLGFEKLHRPDVHVLETERQVDFEYLSAGETDGDAGAATTHRVIAKIDRIDQVTCEDGSAAFRIVDYKTGQPTKKLLEPDPKDLQMGLYVLALRHEYGEDITGSAEYWLFSTGQRGVIDFADVDERGVRKQIDKVVAGILSGRFPRAKNCHGEVCEFLGPDDDSAEE